MIVLNGFPLNIKNLIIWYQICRFSSLCFIFRAQSRKRNCKAWYHCPSSLGGKFGKCNQDHRYRFLWVRWPKSSVLLPKLYPKRENSNPKLFLSEIAFGQQNQTSGNEPKGIVNKDLGYVSQIILPKTMGNDTMPCSFVYVIAP